MIGKRVDILAGKTRIKRRGYRLLQGADQARGSKGQGIKAVLDDGADIQQRDLVEIHQQQPQHHGAMMADAIMQHAFPAYRLFSVVCALPHPVVPGPGNTHDGQHRADNGLRQKNLAEIDFLVNRQQPQ